MTARDDVQAETDQVRALDRLSVLDARMRAIHRLFAEGEGARIRPVPGTGFTAWEPLEAADRDASRAAQELTALAWRFEEQRAADPWLAGPAPTASPVQRLRAALTETEREPLPDADRRAFVQADWIAALALAVLAVLVVVLTHYGQALRD